MMETSGTSRKPGFSTGLPRVRDGGSLEKAMSGLIVPEKDAHKYCLVVASLMVESQEEPAWFRKHYYADGELAQLTKCGLSVKDLAIGALALNLSYQLPPMQQPKDIKRRLKAERTRLQKARRGLASLKDDFRPDGLKQKSRSTIVHLDGGVTIELEPDPYEEILLAIDRFLQRSGLIGHQGGGRKTILYYAVALLVKKLEGWAHKPSIPELEVLCQDLFDKVREHNERSSGPFRYHDMLRRIELESQDPNETV
jgi:hypothetical protein